MGGAGAPNAGGAAGATPAPTAGGAKPAAPGAPAAPAAPAAAPDGSTPSGKPGVSVLPNGKQVADTTGLTQFETGVEFQPRNPDYRVTFSLEDADLDQLVRVIAQLTGKRFIFGGKVRNIKATVYSPQKVTVAEAYQAFLAILETNGLTVVPHGRFLKIVETAGIATQDTPFYSAGQGAPGEERYITRIHRLSHVSADEVKGVLEHFKTKDGDITVYGPGNLLIITDTGTNIRRMMELVQDVDVGAAGDQMWIEPIHYASASEVSTRINDILEIKEHGSGAPAGGKGGTPSTSPLATGGGGARLTKITSDDRSNALVIVGNEAGYLRALTIIRELDIPQTGEGELRVLALQHADATELTKTLNEIITAAAQAAQPAAGAGGKGGAPPEGIFEGRIKVSADKATNSIVVTASKRDYAELHGVVDKLDQPRRQVFIEAVIMDLTVARSNQWGSNFHLGDTIPSNNGDGLVYGGLNPLKTIGLPDPTSLQGMALGVRGPGIPGSETLLGTGITIPAFGVLINALAHSEDTDVLSTPHILATDNVPAEINVGQNIPLQTNAGAGLAGLAGAGGTGAAAGAIGGLGALGFGGGFAAPRQDVGTKIKVIPHLNESNEVRLELTEEISEASATPVGALGTIALVKRTAATTLTVRDQQTVVIGGLMRNRTSHSEDKIPVLGDIPVLGALFRQSKNDNQKSNLILVLTPYIIREQSDLRTVFERKMQERQEFLDRYFVFNEEHEYHPPHDWSRANGLVEDIRQSYLNVEEQKAIDELTKPKDRKTHEPGQPIELLGPRGAGDVTVGAPTPAPPGGGAPPSPLNVNPPPRAVDRVER